LISRISSILVWYKYFILKVKIHPINMTIHPVTRGHKPSFKKRPSRYFISRPSIPLMSLLYKKSSSPSNLIIKIEDHPEPEEFPTVTTSTSSFIPVAIKQEEEDTTSLQFYIQSLQTYDDSITFNRWFITASI
jgi:hypothetical protein